MNSDDVYYCVVIFLFIDSYMPRLYFTMATPFPCNQPYKLSSNPYFPILFFALLPTS